MSQPLYKTPKTSFLAPNQLMIHQTLQHINLPNQVTETQQIQLHQLIKETIPSYRT